MLPYLQIGNRQIPVYAICGLLGAGAFALLCLCRAKRFRVARADVFYLSLYALVGVLIGAKVLYWLTILPWLVQHWSEIIADGALLQAVLLQGYVFYGGLLGGVFMGWRYLRRYQLAAGPFLDAMTPGIPLLHAFGRVGCFLAGCCYGVPWRYGIAYPAAHPSGGVALFPVQLVEAAGNLLLCAVLCWLSRRWPGSGRTLGVYGVAYGLMRFTLEFFRGDAVRGSVWVLSVSQWISLGVIVGGALWLWRCQRQKAADLEDHTI